MKSTVHAFVKMYDVLHMLKIGVALPLSPEGSEVS